MFSFRDNQKILNKENLFKKTTSYNIFRHYVGEFRLGKAISSPLREDKHPSFTINVNKATGEFFFDDKVLGGGDSINFIMRLYGINFREALLKIVKELGLADEFILSEEERKGKISDKKIEYKVDIKKLIKDSEVEIDVKSRVWTKDDVYFWKKFGITRKTLEKYNVSPISYIFFKNKIVKADKFAYVFREFKDYKESLTIYQPFNKERKWIKTHDSSVWYGWDQLPDTNKKLIITKSMKDVMSLVENTKYPSTGLQNEKVLPKLGVILELRGRFEDIFILYDNDFDKEQNWGRIAGKRLEDEFGFIQIEIPDKYKCKDFSDLVAKFGTEKANEILEEILNNVIYF